MDHSGLHEEGAVGWRRRRRATEARSPAIVIGLDSITGLQTARILAARRIPVVGIADNTAHPCCRTNACVAIEATDPGELGLLGTLERLEPRLVGEDFGPRPAVLFPCTDASVLMLSRHRARLGPWLRYALPDTAVIELLTDKERFYRYAQQRGLPIPHTEFMRSREDALEAGRSLRFPCILKPAVKTAEWRAVATAKAYVATSAEELLELYDRLSTSGQCLIAQALVEGPDREHFTCNCYLDEASRPLVTFVSRKLRQWPPRSGEGCLSEEARNDEVLETTLGLFGTLGYRGLGYLEMKRDPRTGEHFIIEPNAGRPTGRSANAEAAGVELLHTQYCDLLGHPLPEGREQLYRGVKWVHTRRDVQSAVHRIRKGELTVREWLASWRGPIFHAVLSWRDPVPFLADLVRAGGRFAGRGRRARLPSPRPSRAQRPAPADVRVRSRGARGAVATVPVDATVRILTYHRVIDPRHPSVGHPGLVSATPADFERQMQYLQRYYDVVSARQVLDALQGGPALPPRPVLITFDDAYTDFADVAWPILRRHGFPVTLFVPTAYPDDPTREFWWDRLYRAFSSTTRAELIGTPLGRLDVRPGHRRTSERTLRRWLTTIPHEEALDWIAVVCRQLDVTDVERAPILGWEALRRLAATGVSLAPHTRTHPRLGGMPLEEAAAEIRGSREDLEREVGPSERIFAYPFGARDDRLVRVLRQERFEAAVTQRHGHNALATADPFGLHRTNVTRRTSPAVLAVRLTSSGARVDGWRRAYYRRRALRRTAHRLRRPATA